MVGIEGYSASARASYTLNKEECIDLALILVPPSLTPPAPEALFVSFGSVSKGTEKRNTMIR